MNQLYALSRPHPYKLHTAWAWCLLLGLLSLSLTTSAQTITGTVFRDFNADGVYATIPASGTYTYGEPGVSGIIVTAYSSNSAAGPISATTNASGSYSLNVGSTGQFRLEFTNVVAGDFTGFVSTTATANKTDIQFVNGGSTNVNLGINYPAQYCGVVNPYLATSCYTNGDPLTAPSSATGNPANDPWLVGWQYDGANTGRNTYLSKGSIGSTWGLAYDRSSKLLFMAAFMKRHSGFGTGGPGQIYSVNMTTPTSASTTIAPFVNLQTDLGIAVGTDPRLTDPLPNNKTTPNHDAAAFDLVGKMSLGDIDISDDDRTLWVMNLFDRALYELPIGKPAIKPTTYTKHILPTAGCVNGTLRPFATKFYRGKVYIGAVCSAEASGGTAANLTALVFAHDPAGATSNFTQVLTFPLNYTRGYAASRGTAGGTGLAVLPGEWRPWIAQWTSIPNSLTSGAYTQTACPQPVLSDIEFDVNGEMILGFFDRFGHQAGNNNYSPITSSTMVYEAVAAGDLLRAGRKADGTYQIENNASVTNSPANGAPAVTVATAAVNQVIPQGPGGGEFYWQDMYSKDATPNSTTADGGHQEILVGGLTLWSGQGEVVSTAFDPFSDFRAAGARYFNNATGMSNFEYEVISQDGGLTTAQRAATFGKAASLGDLELLCNPSPVQIGNRVWNDLNNNGIQDAGEPALAGVTVILKGPGSTTVATVTTNANGEYYFSNATGTNATGFAYNLASLSLGGSYSICFPTSFSALSLSTKPNSATGANADRIDSDATVAGIISFTLGQAGENNFTYDAGYAILPCSLTATATAGACSPTTNLYTVTGSISLTSNTAGGVATITDGAKSITVTVPAAATSVAYSLTGLSSGTNSHTVIVNLPSCGSATVIYTAPPSCTVGIGVIVATPVCNTLTNNYTATGTVSLTNAQAGSLTITDGSLTQTVSVTAGQSTATFTLTGVSGSTPPSHTVVASLGTATASTTYATPASCTVCSLSITTASLPAGQVGTAYSQTITTSGGTAPVSYSLTGSLPAGLSLNASTGVISGTPTASGTASFSVKVTDGKSCSALVPLSIMTSAAPVCSLSASVTKSLCASATNTYSTTVSVTITNPLAGTLTITDGTRSQTLTIPANTTGATASFSGLISDGLTHTVVISLPGCGSTTATYDAPASCSVAPPCSISAVATAGVCASATNTYSVTVNVTVTNPTAGTVSVTNQGITQALSTTAGPSQNTFGFVFNGLVSNGQSYSAMVSLPGCGSAMATYAAPVSCTVAEVCTLSLTTASLPAGQVGTAYSQTLTTSGATGITTFTLASGSLPAGLSLVAATGIITGTPSATGTASFTVKVTDAKGCTATVPLSISVAPVPTSFCSLTVTPVAGLCTTVASGTTVSSVFSSTINVTFVPNTPAGTLVISDGSSNSTVTVTANQAAATLVFAGLPANGSIRTVSYGFTSGATDCGVFALTYVAPQSCQPVVANPVLNLTKVVSKSKAAIGETISYTLVLTNTGSATAATTVRDSLSSGAAYVTGSASVPAGTSFTPGSPVSLWQVASIAPGTSLSLTFAVTATEVGIVYNTATIPGDTASVCTSVPAQVCPGDVFEYEITAKAGRSSYRWYRTVAGVTTELTSFTTNVLSVTAVGEYKLAVDNVEGKCPDFSCCPFIVEEVAPVASFSLVATSLSCSGAVAQTDGTVQITGLVSTTASGTLTYQLAQGGTDFESGTLLTPSKTALPVNGIVGVGLAAGTYRVRVYNAAGCYRDAVVVIAPANCACPPVKCVPFVIQQTQKAPRVVVR